MSDFYVDTLNKLLAQNVLRRDMKLLVTCAGEYDRDVLLQCGFARATLSNLATSSNGTKCAPFDWSEQDAENLTLADDEVDFSIAHSGLHHCRSPHRALLEMYRVARRGVIVFEPCDNWTTRLGVRLGFGQEYELAAVAGAGCVSGGQRNTSLPNYVYRWTRREVEKTICSYAPVGRHTFHYFYQLRIPWYRSQMMRGRLLDGAFRLLAPLAHGITRIFPRASNNVAFVVLKPQVPQDLHPWLKPTGDGVRLDTAWLQERYCRGAAASGQYADNA